jgi:hypothetical protein
MAAVAVHAAAMFFMAGLIELTFVLPINAVVYNLFIVQVILTFTAFFYAVTVLLPLFCFAI